MCFISYYLSLSPCSFERKKRGEIMWIRFPCKTFIINPVYFKIYRRGCKKNKIISFRFLFIFLLLHSFLLVKEHSSLKFVFTSFSYYPPYFLTLIPLKSFSKLLWIVYRKFLVKSLKHFLLKNLQNCCYVKDYINLRKAQEKLLYLF